MKHFDILKRSWDILWSYKTLWVFGIILALTAASGSGSGSNGGSSAGGGSSFLIPTQTKLAQTWDEAGHTMARLTERAAQTSDLEPWTIALIIAAVLLSLVIGIIFTVGHFVSQVALIRMVDRHEDTAEKLSWRQGFRLGWSKAAWRLFLISFMIGLAAVLVFTLLFGLAALPGVLGGMIGDAALAIGIILSVLFGIPVIILAILTALLVSLVLETVRRVCVLEERGVLESLRHGWQLMRDHFVDLGLMWLLTIGVRIGFSIVVIPVGIVLLVVALLLGGGLGGLIYLLTSALAAGWIIAAVIGGLLFITILALPFTFLGGLLQTYLSTTWTLTYRALKAA